ncbi:MAG: hypothetical protein ACRDRT_09885, partial [Pseudonocardiaceae bacterium]
LENRLGAWHSNILPLLWHRLEGRLDVLTRSPRSRLIPDSWRIVGGWLPGSAYRGAPEGRPAGDIQLMTGQLKMRSSPWPPGYLRRRR